MGFLFYSISVESKIDSFASYCLRLIIVLAKITKLIAQGHYANINNNSHE